MDFSKLNLEFSNMQIIITKYNEITTSIKDRIKNNNREISKLENKIKNTKVLLEKDSYKLIINSYKRENNYLENLIKEDKQDGQQTGNAKTI